MGRILILAAAILLAVTAVIHALGQPMVDHWVKALDHRQAAAVCLVWLTDSLSWTIVAMLWVIAGLRLDRQWLAASAIAMVIPAATAIAMMTIDPSFYGVWMLVGSVLLAAGGLRLCWRR